MRRLLTLTTVALLLVLCGFVLFPGAKRHGRADARESRSDRPDAREAYADCVRPFP